MSKNPFPMRMCVGCRQSMDKAKLCRVVYDGNGKAAVDTAGTMPGRGAYVCNDSKCIEKALKTGKISRTLKTKIPEGILNEYGKQ